MVKYKEVPGDSMTSAANYARAMVRLAEAITDFERQADRLSESDLLITSMTIRCPGFDRGDYLLVLRGTTPDGAVVAFHNAPTLWETLEGAVNRLKNGSLKWKEDQYGR
jgi:hypothetical protein